MYFKRIVYSTSDHRCHGYEQGLKIIFRFHEFQQYIT